MKSKIKTILFDFDGVLVPNTPQMFVDLTYQVVNRHTYLAKETILQYFRSAVSFSPWEAIQFFFHELGIESLLSEIKDEHQKNTINNSNFKNMIDQDFYSIIALLDLKGIQWKIVSLGSNETLQKIFSIKSENIYDLKRQSKANPKTFETLATSQMLRPEECLLIDDGILALRAAKLTGINTTFMQNNFYGTEEHYQFYEEIVDHRVFNMKELKDYISQIS